MVTSGSFEGPVAGEVAEVTGEPVQGPGASTLDLGCHTGLGEGMNDPEATMPNALANSNLAEGHGRSGRDRTHLWRIAHPSAKEVDSHLRLLARAGVVNSGRAAMTSVAFEEVRAMTWRLLHPRR